MTPPNIDSLLGGLPRSLGTYAPVLQEIEAALNDPNGSLSSVAEAIEKDPDLTARLIRLGNSSYYGFPARLATVSETISLIGLQQVQDLILASSVLRVFSGLSAEFVDMESFWRHSLACGISARALAMTVRLPKPDKYFVAGLLHDVGRLVLFSQAPQAVGAVFALYRRERVLLHDAEMRVLGYDHALIGEALLQRWLFPAPVAYAVGHHHSLTSHETYGEETAVVHLADHLVNALALGTSGERFVPPLKVTAWQTLRLTIDVIASVVEVIDDQLEAVETAFLQAKPGERA